MKKGLKIVSLMLVLCLLAVPVNAEGNVEARGSRFFSSYCTFLAPGDHYAVEVWFDVDANAVHSDGEQSSDEKDIPWSDEETNPDKSIKEKDHTSAPTIRRSDKPHSIEVDGHIFRFSKEVGGARYYYCSYRRAPWARRAKSKHCKASVTLSSSSLQPINWNLVHSFHTFDEDRIIARNKKKVALHEIVDQLISHEQMTFRRLEELISIKEKTENVATFLAVLELIRGKRIEMDDDGHIKMLGRKERK